jgi:chemotaxis-related protein WspD
VSGDHRVRWTDEQAAEAARRFLDRPAPAGYLDAWARSLTRALFEERAADERVAIVFRLGEDLLALDVGCVREVHRPRRVHRVPGRSNEVFRGLTCLRGELVLAADLHAMLGAPRPAAPPQSARTVRIEDGGAAWAFDVDELLDVKRYDAAQVSRPQVTVAKSPAHFTDGLVPLGEGRHAARLDAQRLFAGLARSLA